MASATPDLRLPSQPQGIGWYQIILLGDRGTCVLTTNLQGAWHILAASCTGCYMQCKS